MEPAYEHLSNGGRYEAPIFELDEEAEPRPEMPLPEPTSKMDIDVYIKSVAAHVGAYHPMPGEMDEKIAMGSGQDHLTGIYGRHYPRATEEKDTHSIHTTTRGRSRMSRPYDNETMASTRSLYEADLDYVFENDRRYQDSYWQPNDEDEQIRMSITHQTLYFLFDSQHTTVPLSEPTRILDIGTGNGDWAIDMGERFPTADVIGTDLSAIQPSAVPHNVFFEIFDAEDEIGWSYQPDSFDLIHFRNMDGAFSNWDRMYSLSFMHVKPGGWVEVIDWGEQRGFASHFKADSEVHRWLQAIQAAAKVSGAARFEHLLESRLVDAGFEDVSLVKHNIPFGMWNDDLNQRRTAKLWLVSCLAGMEAVSLRPLTKYLGWEASEVRNICDNIKQELLQIAMDKKNATGFSLSVKVLKGRKPLRVVQESTIGKGKRKASSLFEEQESPEMALRLSAGALTPTTNCAARGPPVEPITEVDSASISTTTMPLSKMPTRMLHDSHEATYMDLVVDTDELAETETGKGCHRSDDIQPDHALGVTTSVRATTTLDDMAVQRAGQLHGLKRHSDIIGLETNNGIRYQSGIRLEVDDEMSAPDEIHWGPSVDDDVHHRSDIPYDLEIDDSTTI